MTPSPHIRTMALIPIIGCGILVSAAPAAMSAQGGNGHAATTRHGDRAVIAPAGLAGAPLLTEWWRQVIIKSADDPAQPFLSGGCRTARNGTVLSYLVGHCTVRQGTSIFAVGFSVECSNVEAEPFHADTPL